MRTFFLIFTIFACFEVNAQTQEKFACGKAKRLVVRSFFENIEKYNATMQKIEDGRSLRKLPFCWHGCAVSLPKPIFSAAAKKTGLFGKVRVETIADGSGQIFYAKAVDGPMIFRRDAETAACSSRFIAIIFDGQPIPYRWSIVYNFIRQ